MTDHAPQGVNWAAVASNISNAFDIVGRNLILISTAENVSQSEYVALNEPSSDLRQSTPPKTIRGVLVDFEQMVAGEDNAFTWKCTAFISAHNLVSDDISIGDLIKDGDDTYVVSMIKKQQVGPVQLVFEVELRQ